MERIYGIDLGTTYSCIAYIDEYHQPTVIPNPNDNALTTPSVVFFEPGGNVIVGTSAKEEYITSPERVVSEVKREMGNPDWSFEIDGESYSAIDISTIILKEIARGAEISLGEPIKDVVITVPAYFGANEREATMEAGKKAGLNVRHIINEPTAAALEFDLADKEESTMMVFDLGGGTFDITVINIQANSVEAVATDGDHKLGGVDWDQALSELIIELAAEEADVSPSEIEAAHETLVEIKAQTEQVKKRLTERTSCPLRVVYQSDDDFRRINLEITRDQFEAATKAKLEQVMSYTHKVLSDAEANGASNIDEIVLVGGSSLMPQIQERLRAEFPDVDQRLIDPSLAVAKGAAVFAQKVQVTDWLEEFARKEVPNYDGSTPAIDLLTEEQKITAYEELVTETRSHSASSLRAITEKTIITVTPKSLGIVALNDEGNGLTEMVFNLVQRNTPVPAEGEYRFGTQTPNQLVADLICVENGRDNDTSDPFEYNPDQVIGKAVLELDGTAPEGSPITVRIGYDDQGMITVVGEDEKSGSTTKASFESGAILSDAELAQRRAEFAE